MTKSEYIFHKYAQHVERVGNEYMMSPIVSVANNPEQSQIRTEVYSKLWPEATGNKNSNKLDLYNLFKKDRFKLNNFSKWVTGKPYIKGITEYSDVEGGSLSSDEGAHSRMTTPGYITNGINNPGYVDDNTFLGKSINKHIDDALNNYKPYIVMNPTHLTFNPQPNTFTTEVLAHELIHNAKRPPYSRIPEEIPIEVWNYMREAPVIRKTDMFMDKNIYNTLNNIMRYK